MQAVIGINPNYIDEIAKKLCRVLADEFVIYVKTLNAHWNIEGPDFYNKHLFFEKQYGEMIEIVDTVAERIRSLGHYAPATLEAFLQLTHFTEATRQNNSSSGFMETLLDDHDAIVVTLRATVNTFINELKDAGTGDFVTGLIETHEKMAWMLRAHLR